MPRMSIPRLSTLLAVLLASFGLAALPGAAFAQDEPIDEEIEFVEEDMWCEDDFTGGGETVAEEDEELFGDADLRQVDDGEFFDEEDPDFLGPDGEDPVFEDEPSDDELLDDCLDEETEELADDASAQVVGSVTKLVKKGVLTFTLKVPGKGRVKSTLTKGQTKLGKASKKVAKAGKVTIKLKLTKKGRKVVRNATQTLHLTLTSQIKLAKGRTLTRTTRIDV